MMTRKLKKSSIDDFIKPLAALTSGSFIAQVLTIVASPIMTRLYTTEQIGVYTLVLAAIGMFGGSICARYDMVIVTEPDEENVNRIVVLCFWVSLLLSGLIGIGYYFYFGSIEYGVKQSFFSSIAVFVLLALTGITNILLSYNNRFREYNLVASVGVIRALAKEGVMIVAGFLAPSSLCLVFSQIFGTSSGVFRQSRTLRDRTEGLKRLGQIKYGEIKKVAVKHKKQPIFSAPAIFVNNFSYSSLNYFINSLYGASVLGLYSVSYRLLGLPLSIISNNVSRVYYEKALSLYNNHESYRNLLLKTSVALFAVSVPITAIIFFLSPKVFAVVFGSQYYQAGIYARCLAPMFGVRFIVSPLTVGMIVSKKQDYELIVQGLFMLASVIIFFIFKTTAFAIQNYLISISLVYTLIYFVYFFLLVKVSKRALPV